MIREAVIWKFVRTDSVYSRANLCVNLATFEAREAPVQAISLFLVPYMPMLLYDSFMHFAY